MQDLIVRDVRLLGGKPAGREVLEVDDKTPIDWPIAWARQRADAYGGDACLKVLAHGFEQRLPVVATKTYRSGIVTQAPIFSQGGAGIQFCRENIRLDTLGRFALLRGKLKGIDLMGCGAAYITPGFEGTDGDGNLLCHRLAQVTGTYVRASTATQFYNTTGPLWAPIDFGVWEGTVITYAPNGSVYKVESGASAPTSCTIRPAIP
jgi:hypothetical protein